MDAVANLLELEKLAIDFTKITVMTFAKIRKLKKLRDLTLICSNNDSEMKFKTLAESDNTSLVKLTLKGRFKMSVDSIFWLAKSTPHLKHFNVLLVASHSRFEMSKDELDAILRHFSFIEVLSIDIDSEPLVDPSNYINPNLRELSICVIDIDLLYEEWFTGLTTAYPNVKKLKLTIMSQLRFLKISPILEGFTKLESLTINARNDQLIVDDLHCFHDYKEKIKFLSLGQLYDIASTLKILRENFSVVEVDHRTLSMAVDRRTMSLERKVDGPY